MSDQELWRATKGPIWSSWGQRLVALTALGTAVALGHAWTVQYANVEGNGFFSQRISGPILDHVDVPADVEPVKPLFGLHYFSDLQQLLAYGQTADPYMSSEPTQFLPLGVFQFRLLGVLGEQIGLWVFLTLAIGLLGLVGWRLMGDLPAPSKIVTVVFLVVLTPAMLMSIDRGALSPIAIGMVGLAFLFARNRKFILAALILTLAISLKSYLLLVLIYPFFRGYWKFALGTVATVFTVNLAAFTLFPSGFIHSMGGFLSANLQFAAAGSDGSPNTVIKFITLDAVSAPGTMLRIVAWWKNIDVSSMIYDQFASFTLVPGMIFLVSLLLVLLNRNFPYWIPITMVLATTTVVLPATPLYTFVWVSLAAFYFGSKGADPFPMNPIRSHQVRGIRVLRVAFMVAISISLIPTFWLIPGLERGQQDAAGLMGPLAVLLASGLALVVSGVDLMSRRAGNPTESRTVKGSERR